MGVEYRHFIIPADPNWLPQADTATRIHKVLEAWGLVTDEPEAFDLTDNLQTPISLSQALSFPINAGIAIIYPWVEGSAVSSIIGDSCYPDIDIDESERYLQAISFVSGLDIRIHPDSELFCFTVTHPPYNGENSVEAYSTESADSTSKCNSEIST